VTSSHRQILSSSSIIGGASLINIVLGLARQKVLALLLGPAGLGMLGLLQSVVTTGAVVAGMGVGNAGTRQIAEAAGTGDPVRLAVARKALLWLTILLAIVGGGALWLFRSALAEVIFPRSAMAGAFGMLALALALTIGAASQMALLVGMQRIGDVARVTVYSALASSIAGVAAIAVYRDAGILYFVVSAPLAALLIGFAYTRRLRPPPLVAAPAAALPAQWRAMLALGVAATLAGLASTGSQLAARILVQRELGPVPLGALQAASVITVTYLGLILQAMSTDYYPRLTRTVGDRAVTNRLVNEQAEVTLLLGGPILLAMMGAAPVAVTILYSSAFTGAADLLRLQIFADVLRLASWPLGYLLLAIGAGRAYVAAETGVAAVFVLLVMLLLGPAGLNAVGFALIGLYAAYLPAVYWAARRLTGFRWARPVLALGAILFILNAAVYAIGRLGTPAALAAGCLASLAYGFLALHRLRTHMPDRFARLLAPLSRWADRLEVAIRSRFAR
jgi:PST family polysaccharide transporter